MLQRSIKVVWFLYVCKCICVPVSMVCVSRPAEAYSEKASRAVEGEEEVVVAKKLRKRLDNGIAPGVKEKEVQHR